MYALVANGGVQAVAETTRKTTGGIWLRLVEDGATFDPTQPQQPAGYTVEGERVIRHWRAIPRPATIDDIAAVIDQLRPVAEAVVDLAPQEDRQAVATKLAGLVQQDEPGLPIVKGAK